MSLLLNAEGNPVRNVFVTVADDQPLPANGEIIVSAERLLKEAETFAAHRGAVGVALGNDLDPEILAPVLDRIDLVTVNFPSFADGRAYSQARLLRDALGFSGPIRATGDVLRDQAPLMSRVGIDQFEVKEATHLAGWKAAKEMISVVYQAAHDRQVPAFRLRHATALAAE